MRLSERCERTAGWRSAFFSRFLHAFSHSFSVALTLGLSQTVKDTEINSRARICTLFRICNHDNFCHLFDLISDVFCHQALIRPTSQSGADHSQAKIVSSWYEMVLFYISKERLRCV